jgi:hypothetical protein
MQLPANNCADGVRLEEKRGYDPKVAAAIANRPEQILVFFATGGYKTAIGQNPINSEPIIDGQAEFSGSNNQFRLPG